METNEPKGIFISKNNKGQFVYSDMFMKGGYLITKKEYPKYRNYALRYFIGVAIIILFSSTILDFMPSLFLGLATIIVGEILFRIRFLKGSCTYIPDYKMEPGKTIIDNLVASSTKGKTIIKVFLYILFGGLIVLNAQDQGYTGLPLTLSWIIGVISEIIALFLLVVYIKLRDKK